jgi:hypothetical protein
MNDDLERAIDGVGRDKVFRRAREIGWTDSAPPAWVWWGIVNELRNAPATDEFPYREGAVFLCSVPEALGAVLGIQMRRGRVTVNTDGGHVMIIPDGPRPGVQ